MTQYKSNKHKRASSFELASPAIVLLAIILPAYAIYKASKAIDIKYMIAYFVIISAATVFIYWSDKRKARTESWRTPESTLRVLELAGGCVAAHFSQRIFRHKISKIKYQISFWIVAAIQNYAAFDYLNDWHSARTVFLHIKPHFT